MNYLLEGRIKTVTTIEDSNGAVHHLCKIDIYSNVEINGKKYLLAVESLNQQTFKQVDCEAYFECAFDLSHYSNKEAVVLFEKLAKKIEYKEFGFAAKYKIIGIRNK